MSIQQQPLPAQKTRTTSVFTTGLALFSMFFGAGNLIFPLLVGKTVGNNIWFAISGLGLTAVLVPLLGLAAMFLFEADYHRFFGRIGRLPGLMLLLLLQLISGPFGVIPRLITLMHATAKPYLFDMPLEVFTLLAVSAIFLFCVKQQKLIALLGAILTPLLLLSLVALVFFGLKDASSLHPVSTPAAECFLQGLLGGYNMMDLIGSFLFASVAIPHFTRDALSQGRKQRFSLKKMLFSSLIAASLLFSAYVGLCLVSAHHGAKLEASLPPEQMLHRIATVLLGKIGGSIAAIAVILACLTTAITLTSIFANYLRKEIFKEKVGFKWALILTLITTALFAHLGFGGIASFLGPIVQVVYPGLILLTVLNLLHAVYGWHMVRWPVFLAFTLSAMLLFRGAFETLFP